MRGSCPPRSQSGKFFLSYAMRTLSGMFLFANKVLWALMYEAVIFPSIGLACMHAGHVSYSGHARIT